MTGTIWTPVLGWVGAIAVATGLALSMPTESGLLGKLPDLQGKRLDDETPLVLPRDLPSERTVAVVVFRKTQREAAQRWVDGLGLEREAHIPWIRLPVLGEAGSAERRRELEQRLLALYPTPAEQARLVPLFTDRQAFMRAAGLSSEQATVLVLDRQGHVLAKAQGPFDAAKAQALRETVLARN